MAARKKTPKPKAGPKRKAAKRKAAPKRSARRQLPNDDAWRELVETAIEKPNVSAAPRRRSK